MAIDTIPTELVTAPHEAMRNAQKGRYPAAMRNAREEMNRNREALRQRMGAVDVAVELIRDARK